MSLFDRFWSKAGSRIFLSWSWPFAQTGFEQVKNLAVLMDAICEAYDRAWIDPKGFAPKDGATYCNEAVQFVAGVFNYDRFAGKLANEIVDILNNDKRWVKISPNEAASRACEGILVIAARKDTPHGHVCVVRPGTTESSGHWQENAPKVMNIGKDCFISKGANYAFHEKPDYFSLEG